MLFVVPTYVSFSCSLISAAIFGASASGVSWRVHAVAFLLVGSCCQVFQKYIYRLYIGHLLHGKPMGGANTWTSQHLACA